MSDMTFVLFRKLRLGNMQYLVNAHGTPNIYACYTAYQSSFAVAANKAH